MIFHKDKEIEPDKNPLGYLKILSRYREKKHGVNSLQH
jgi:hypothetical protein